MRKLFKKSLAICIAAVLCVTLFAGALSVNADAALTYSTNAIEANPGDQVEIEFTISNFSDVEGARLSLTLPSVIESIDAVSYGETALAEFDNDEGTGDYIIENVRTIKLLSLFGSTAFDNFPSTDTFTLNITATVADDAEEGVYAYGTPVIELGTESALLEATGEFGTFEVVEPIVGPTEPVVDENITVSASILVSQTLGVMYTIGNLSSYDDFEVVVNRNAYSTVNYNLTESSDTVTKSQATLYKGTYYASVYGFALTDLCLDVTAVVNCYDSEGTLVATSNVLTTTLKDLAVNLYSTTPAVNTKTILTDLLNMGAEAQSYFAGRYPSSALATVADSEYPNYGFDQTYATNTIPDLTYGEGQTLNSGAKIDAVGSILMSPAIMYTLTPAATPSNLSLEVSYYDAYNKQNKNVVVSADQMTIYKGKYYYNFESLPLYSSNAVITATVKDGETVLGTHTYTVEQYAGANLDNATTGSLLRAVAKFGASARTYFKIS